MNCNTLTHSNNCSCNLTCGTQFWSKKKKIEVLEHYLKCLEEKKQDIQETINEIKEEKL